MSVIRFEEHSKITFENNTATMTGGAICSLQTSNTFFTQWSTVLFYNNNAQFGESIYTNYNSSVTITTNATVMFNNDIARWYGGVPYSNKYGYSDIEFDSNGIVTCSNLESLPVCINQVCFCQSIDNVLDSLTSNTHIDISINVTLSSVIPLVNLYNISITGHNNPIINCSSDGGVMFTNCHNCTIKGITWNGCGGKETNDNTTVPVIGFYHFTNVTIQNCTFQHSVGQAVVLSEIPENIKIHHCGFYTTNIMKVMVQLYTPLYQVIVLSFCLQLIIAVSLIMKGLIVLFTSVNITTNYSYFT